jgi:hypothetical protein
VPFRGACSAIRPVSGCKTGCRGRSEQLQRKDTWSDTGTGLHCAQITGVRKEALHCRGDLQRAPPASVHRPEKEAVHCRGDLQRAPPASVHRSEKEAVHCGGDLQRAPPASVNRPEKEAVHCRSDLQRAPPASVHRPEKEAVHCKSNLHLVQSLEEIRSGRTNSVAVGL